MIAPAVRAVADAVLYEGYILYPYRKSSLKNRQRWTFGGIFPQSYAERGGERGAMACECLLRGGPRTRLRVTLRFLQIVERSIARPKPDATLEIVPSLTVDGQTYLPWEEAVEREVAVPEISLATLLQAPDETDFCFAAKETRDPIGDGTAGTILRRNETLTGHIALSAVRAGGDTFRITLRAENRSRMPAVADMRRDAALPFSFASSHAILETENGRFVSLIDPPPELRTAADACTNEGCWPVLAGSEGETHTVLAAPIILYDHPKVAPESDRDLFDATEIDEILILRILTMTEAEKREMAAGDARARALLERVEALTPDELGRLHGTWRSVAGEAQMRAAKPELVSLRNGASRLAVGDQVRLKPKPRGDIMDLALQDRVGIVEAIERDFDDRTHIAVVIDDDPGREFGLARLPGHRFFFSPDELEAVTGERP
jgi:hydrogenase maturation protease